MFDVKGQSHVVLKIYNLAGQEIVTLLNEKMKAGHHKIMFDASKFSSGLYFYLIEMEGFKEYKKMLLIH